MPTMPTSLPRHSKEIRFPQELSELNHKPVRYFNDSMHGGNIDDSFGNPFATETSVNQLWHKTKDNNVDFMAMAGVRENHKKDRQMVTGEKNRHIYKMLQNGVRGGCSDCDRHEDMMRGGLMNMMGPSTIEGANVLAGRGMTGGVMRTQAGAQYLKKRLTARIAELDTTGQDVNGVGAENPNDEEKVDEDDTVLMNLGEYLDNMIESVSTGYIESSNVKDARGFLKSLLQGGWQIPSNQLVNLQRNLDDTVRELEASLGNKASTYALSSDRKKIVRTMLTTLERARSAVEQLVKNSNLSSKERKMVLEAYKPKLRLQLESQLYSQVPNRLRSYRQEGEPPAEDFVNDGAFERTYAVARRPAWYVSLGSIPGKARLPRAVAERIAAKT